jgi:transposase-like protein
MTERERDRHAAHRLAIIRHAQELTGNVSKTCRYYGISRQVYYKWLRRYEDGGVDALRDRSSKPHVSPRATRVEVVGKVIYLRQTYHFGPHKIAMYLQRYHDIELSPSGIWRILKRLDMSRLPSSQRYRRHRDRWKRYEKPEPGHRVQVDVKFISALPGSRRKYYQFTAIDDCTRLRVLRIYDRRLPLSRARSRHRPRLHPAGHPEAQWKGGALPPDRRGRVLPDARRRRDRRRRGLQRAPPRVGGLLQFQPTARRAGRPDSL